MVEGRADGLERDSVLGAEVQPETLVQCLDDPRQRLQLLHAPAAVRLASGGVQGPGLSFQRDPAAAGLLDPERLHVDVLLDLSRQLVAVGRQQPPEVPGEGVELLEVRIGERQHLGEERVQAHVVGELATEVATLVAYRVRRNAGAPVPARRRAGLCVVLGSK